MFKNSSQWLVICDASGENGSSDPCVQHGQRPALASAQSDLRCATIFKEIADSVAVQSDPPHAPADPRTLLPPTHHTYADQEVGRAIRSDIV